MDQIPFRALPRVVQFATMGTFLIGWLIFAEWVIDRHDLHRWLPFYRVGNLCPWDFGIAALIGLLWMALQRRGVRA